MVALLGTADDYVTVAVPEVRTYPSKKGRSQAT